MLDFMRGIEMPRLEWNHLTIGAAVGVAVLVGVALRSIVGKISSLASSIFHKIAEVYHEHPIFIRLRSVNCAKCASEHAMHIQENQEVHEQEMQ